MTGAAAIVSGFSISRGNKDGTVTQLHSQHRNMKCRLPSDRSTATIDRRDAAALGQASAQPAGEQRLSLAFHGDVTPVLDQG
jgi:hypothetical protein